MSSTARIAQLQDMLKEEPNDLFLQYALGLEYAKEQTTFGSAESQFKLVLHLDENYLAAYYQLGQLYEQLNRSFNALEFYQIGLEKARQQKNNKAINEFAEAVFLLED